MFSRDAWVSVVVSCFFFTAMAIIAEIGVRNTIGEMPVVTSLVVGNGQELPLPRPVSRWWDFLIITPWVLTIGVMVRPVVRLWKADSSGANRVGAGLCLIIGLTAGYRCTALVEHGMAALFCIALGMTAGVSQFFAELSITRQFRSSARLGLWAMVASVVTGITAMSLVGGVKLGLPFAILSWTATAALVEASYTLHFWAVAAPVEE